MPKRKPAPKSTSPKIELPRPPGLERHPLVLLSERVGVSGLARQIRSTSGAAHVDRTSVRVYLRRAEVDRNTVVPAEWVLDLWKASGVHPYYWRPDLYPKTGIEPVPSTRRKVRVEGEYVPPVPVTEALADA